jgi:Holliday junction DNA helicase RuvB
MLEDIIGQEEVKEAVMVAIQASRFRKQPMEHILLTGPGGVGKTYLLNAICKETGTRLFVTQGNRLRTVKDVHKLMKMACSDPVVPAFIIIDEFHEMSDECREELYYPMDHGYILGEKGRINLGPFTIAAATTFPENLDIKSLINRFPLNWKLKEVQTNDIFKIVEKWLAKEGLWASDEIAMAIARRSVGIPRLALKYSSRVRDYCQASGRFIIEIGDVKKAFHELGIDRRGLDSLQREYLRILAKDKKAIGLDSISAMLGEFQTDFVKKMLEPHLQKLGFIVSTPKGRLITGAGYEYIQKCKMK